MSIDPIQERSRERRKRIVVNKASSFAEAEAWDLDFWQARTPEERLDAYMALREDVEKVLEAPSGIRVIPMRTVSDFEDMLTLLNGHNVRYLIVGGLAFIYHAKPRYTKDIDLWLAEDDENVQRANGALTEFGSPAVLDPGKSEQILQIGVEPNRIDFLRRLNGSNFESAWSRRIEGTYGAVPANWIHIEDLLSIKASINVPRHQEDARVLREVLRRRDAD